MKILSRSELKQIKGGDGSGSGWPCKNGACTLYVQGSGGQYVPYDGNCKQDPNYLNCYCETGLGDLTLSSNGGVSRCWS